MTVEHFPGLAGALVLHAHELAVQREVVPDGVLKSNIEVLGHITHVQFTFN